MRLKLWLIKLLEQNNVSALWQFLYYTPLLLWGIYGTFFAYPITIIVEAINQTAYNAWVWCTIPATAATMFGLYLRHGGSPATEIKGPLLRRDYLGLCLQFGGHSFMTIILLIFEITGIAGAFWGQPVISLFIASALCQGVPFLAAQCGWKLWRGRQHQ